MARLRPGLTSFHGDLEPAFHEVVTAMGNWDNQIFAYFDHAIADADTIRSPRSFVADSRSTESVNSPTRPANRIYCIRFQSAYCLRTSALGG